MTALTSSASWLALVKHSEATLNNKAKVDFVNNPKRLKQLSLWACDLLLDYSKQNVTTATIALLLELAKTANLTAKCEAMFNGEPINTTENRPVLHTALRNPENNSILVNGTNIMPKIHNVLASMARCVDAVHHGTWKGFSNKNITDIVNIGIGGSYLGPAMVVKALQPFSLPNIKCHFIANIDGTEIAETLKLLNPETTLFIIASKTFTTQETLYNAETAKFWLLNNIHNTNTVTAIQKHFIAVTAKPQLAQNFGIAANNIFPFWDWVGGRFSLWSAIGLIIAMAIGIENFTELLAGAHAMDTHFREAPYEQNMPVILALLSIWNTNFQKCHTHAIIPYDQYLEFLPAYLQQLEMESNGKSTTLEGEFVDYATAPVIWGAVGTNGQHAFHQLLMQGAQTIPVDFIIPLQSHNPMREHHLLLYANCIAQSNALMNGKTIAALTTEMLASGMHEKTIQILVSHKFIPGNIPNNIILTKKITPRTLGSLIALYEHKVFVQGVIWNINSFDQWGVELGKQLTNNFIQKLHETSTKSKSKYDASTENLINLFRLDKI